MADKGYKTIIANVHRDDIERYVAIKKFLFDYFSNLIGSKKDKLQYKFTIKLRLLTDNNIFVPYYLKLKAIATDHKANTWLILGKAIQAKSNDMQFPVIITNVNDCTPQIINPDNTKIIDVVKLSKRESELLQLLSKAKTVSEISSILAIEVNTIKAYKK